MKIFIAGTSFEPSYGGPAVSVSHLAAAVARAGAEVALWAPDGSAITSPVVPTVGNLVCLAGPLKEALSSFGRPDIVHDNGLWLPHNHNIAAMARRDRLTRMVSIRGMLEPYAMRQKSLKKAIAWRLYQRRDLLHSALLHTTSQAEAASVGAYGLGVDIVTIGNGVDLPVEPAFTDRRRRQTGPRTALFIGRLHPIKGLPMLIEAWAHLYPPGWRLLIAGPDEGGHRAVLAGLVEHYGLGDVVEFTGAIDRVEVANAYASADLLVLPSHSENFGMVVVEALAHGLPALTTHGTPWRELETERCGWWVEPTACGLYQGLKAATTQTAASLEAMGARGRKLVAARYGWVSISMQFLNAYRYAARAAWHRYQRRA